MTNSGIPDAAVFVVCVRILREETLGRWRASPFTPPPMYTCVQMYMHVGVYCTGVIISLPA